MKFALLACLALAACASPHWTNPQHPQADLAADTAACDKDAERVGRLNQLAPGDGKGELQGVAASVLARKQCLAAKGWQQE